MGVIKQDITDNYAIYNGDCIEVMRSLPEGCVDFSIYSPPFAAGNGGLYTYSSDERDLSNCGDYEQFFEHYDFVIEQIARLTKQGRLTAVHCTDIPTGNSGKDYLIDFPGDIIRAHQKHGFNLIARHTIWKEPLSVRNRTMTKNLAHKTVVDDAAYAGVASADYLLVFRGKGKNEKPISKPTGMQHYAGGEQMPSDVLKYKNWTGDQKSNRFSHWIWRHYASSVWDDIRLDNVLPYRDCKEEDDEKHVHPLQLDVIERAVELRTNEGETVLTPFMGVGSEVYGSVMNNRSALGIELKESYYRQAKANLDYAVEHGRIGEKAEQEDMFGVA